MQHIIIMNMVQRLLYSGSEIQEMTAKFKTNSLGRVQYGRRWVCMYVGLVLG